MDNSLVSSNGYTLLTPEFRRLISFSKTPIPNISGLSIRISPIKFAEAGFFRVPDATNDEVTCEFCGITYGGWTSESPFAVHRVLNEKCRFFCTPPRSNFHQSLSLPRRRLFYPDNESTISTENPNSEDVTLPNESPQGQIPLYVSAMNPHVAVRHPFHSPVGIDSLLFESRRVKTFSDPRCSELDSKEWAKEGFYFRPEIGDVQCVFCALTLDFNSEVNPKQSHGQKSPTCPIVLMLDAENISEDDERCIQTKYHTGLLRKKNDRSYAIAFPQYDDESMREGTFKIWPPALQKENMSAAGFFYTGLYDKVTCFSCGLSLSKWTRSSDPWEQHAYHMPTCPHLQQKGQHFIEQSAQVQVLTEAHLPKTSNGSELTTADNGQLINSAIGSANLDISAITAALASQYTEQQIRHAVLTFFLKTSRFPTKEILLGTLQAVDTNFDKVCQLRETVHLKDTVIQEKDTVIQEKDTVIQEKDTVIQEKDTVIQEKDTVIQQTYSELQQKDTVIQEKDTVIQEKDTVIQQTSTELQKNQEERGKCIQQLKFQEQQLKFQEQQIESLRLQVQALLAERQQVGLGNTPLRLAANSCSDVARASDLCDHMRCKVCLSAEINTMFHPCRHVSCCNRCVDQLADPLCPVCRTPIHDVLAAHIS